MPRLRRLGLVAGLVLVPALAAGMEFRSVSEPAAILYDAPSTKAQKLFILSRDYPVEVVVKIEGWTKVRDEAGTFAWVENARLSERRTVMVRASGAQARQAPGDAAALAFTAEKDVILEFLELVGGWVRVRHADGAVGFIKVSQLWGV